MLVADLVPANIAAICNPGRMLADGVSYFDLAGAEALDDVSMWFDYWADRALRYEELGDAADNSLSRGELLWQASMAWQYAQLLWFHDSVSRDLGQRKKGRVVQSCRASARAGCGTLRDLL